MMKKLTPWHACQLIQLLVFLAVMLLLLFRTVDGAGAVQTPEIRAVSCLCWLGFYLLLLGVEWLARRVVRRR